MPFLSERMKKVKPSVTMALAAKARALKAEGKPVINLTLGEPNFDTPMHIQDAAVHAIRNGQTRYTEVAGTPELKQAVIGKFQRENNLGYTPEQIIVSSGAKQVLFNALMVSLNPGDEVIIPAPYWVSYPEMVAMADGTPVIVPCGPEQHFKLTPQQLEAAITPLTKWLVLNSPTNPTGAVYSFEELQALAVVLLRHPHVHILSDDIYEHLYYGEGTAHTIASVEPKLYDRTLTVNGVTKAYAMPGWRIGYAGGPAALIKSMVMMQGQSTTNACSISQAATVEALNGDQFCVAKMRSEYLRRRDMMVAKLNACPGLMVEAPQGAFYLYVSCAGVLGKQTADGRVIAGEDDFVTALLEECNIAVVPGEAFGLSPFFRVTFAIGDDEITEACARIQKFCEELR